MDVPGIARPTPRPRLGDEHLPLPAPRLGGATRRGPPATREPGTRGKRLLDGTEQIPPPASVFTEGLYEQHITADIALAQWQYYLATGDRELAEQRGLAGALGRRHLLGLPGRCPGGGGSLTHRRGDRPRRGEVRRRRRDLHQRGGQETSRTPSRPAHVLGLKAPSPGEPWARIAYGIVVPVDASTGVCRSSRDTPAGWSSRPT